MIRLALVQFPTHALFSIFDNILLAGEYISNHFSRYPPFDSYSKCLDNHDDILVFTLMWGRERDEEEKTHQQRYAFHAIDSLNNDK